MHRDLVLGLAVVLELAVEAFRHQYTYLLQKDELYLGYYMHLVEDAFYRAFIYRDGVVMPRTKEEVTLLHNDYHILNSYIVEKYGIRYIFPDKVCLENEPIYAIADFNINGFLAEMAGDFAEQTNGDPIFLTRRMLDAFTETYIPPAVEEIRKIKSGRSALKATDYAWQRNR